MRVGIIGGGIYGTAIAYFLSRAGADVTLFERDGVASGSTGYSAGIVRHHYTDEVQIRMAKRGRELLETLDEHVGHDGGFHRNGYLRLADAEGRAEVERIVERQRRLGIEVELLGPDDLPGYLPAIDPDGVAVAAFEPEAGFADPYLVATGFADRARELGAAVLANTEVTDVAVEGGSVAAVETAGGTHPVDYAVNAAGPRGREVGAMAGLDLPLRRRESKIAVLDAEDDYGPGLPTVSDHSVHPDTYTKPEPGGEFLVGGIERPAVDPDAGLEGVTEGFLRTAGERIERRFPGYADAEVVDTWSGTITVTPDGIQIAGVPDGLEGFFQMVGGSGHGFKEAAAFAESAAATILGEEPRIDLHPYRLERFDEGDAFADVSTETYAKRE